MTNTDTYKRIAEISHQLSELDKTIEDVSQQLNILRATKQTLTTELCDLTRGVTRSKIGTISSSRLHLASELNAHVQYGSVADAAIKLLDQNKGEAISLADIAEHLMKEGSANQYSTVAATVSRLANKGVVKKVGWGQYVRDNSESTDESQRAFGDTA